MSSPPLCPPQPLLPCSTPLFCSKLWALKEAFVKATGEGLGFDLGLLQFEVAANRTGACLLRTLPGGGVGWDGVQAEAGPGLLRAGRAPQWPAPPPSLPCCSHGERAGRARRWLGLLPSRPGQRALGRRGARAARGGRRRLGGERSAGGGRQAAAACCCLAPACCPCFSRAGICCPASAPLLVCMRSCPLPCTWAPPLLHPRRASRPPSARRPLGRASGRRSCAPRSQPSAC